MTKPKDKHPVVADWQEGDLVNEEQAMILLNDREYRFAHAYINANFNATQAMRDIGEPETKRLREIGYSIKNRARVQGYIKWLIKDDLDELSASRERTMREVVNLAFSNVGDLLDEDGDVKPLNSLPRNVLAAIQSLDIETVGTKGDGEAIRVKKLKMIPKTPSLEILCKYHKLLGMDDPNAKQVVEHGLSEELMSLIQRSRPQIDDKSGEE